MKFNLIKDYSIFFWLILVAVIGVVLSATYSKNIEEQNLQIKGTLDNIYLKKTIKEITKNLEPRYTVINYISKTGDTYESILNQLDVKESEKKRY